MNYSRIKGNLICWVKNKSSLRCYEDIFIRNTENINKFKNLSKNISLYDIGSSGETQRPFCWATDFVNIINFEPDPRAKSDSQGRTIPVAIGPKNLDTVFLNKRQTTSSLLKPNKRILDRYDFTKILYGDPDIFLTVGSEKVDTLGLDEVVKSKNLPKPDFIKIDVQGLTHEVLESSTICLNDSVIGLQIEHELIKCYQGQQTFGITHEYLQNIGFELFKLLNHNRWYYKTSRKLKYYSGQEIFYDFVYFRSIDSISDNKKLWDDVKGIKTIFLLLLYDLTDPAVAYLERMESIGIITKETYSDLYSIIVNWDEAVNFFYKTNLIYKLKSYFNFTIDFASKIFLNRQSP